MLQPQLENIFHELSAIQTEWILLLGSLLLLLSGLIQRNIWVIKITYLATLILAGCYAFRSSHSWNEILSKSLIITPLNGAFSVFFIFLGGLILLFKQEKKHVLEFYFLILILLSGTLFLMKSNSLLVLFLSMELISLSGYLLTCFTFKKSGYTIGIKYLLFGVICTAISLFGIGLIYGSTHTFYLSEWQYEWFDSFLSQVGIIFFLIFFLFKIGIVPMHLWVPGVYQRAPSGAVAFMSIISPLATLVLLHRIINTSGIGYWIVQSLIVLAIISVITGTLAALYQKYPKRMIAFGSIAHIGFLLVLILLNTTVSLDSFCWYSVAYACMNMAIFYILDCFEQKNIYEINHYKTFQNYTIGIPLTMILISLAGIPPLAGFTAKFFVFVSLWETYQHHAMEIYLISLIIMIFATVFSLFFYLKIPYNMFIARSKKPKILIFPFYVQLVVLTFAFVLLAMFFVPKIISDARYLLHNT